MSKDLINPSQKYCPRCDIWLLHELFSKNKAQADGLHNYCKQCDSDYQKQKRRERDPELRKRQDRNCHLKQNHGMTESDYEKLLEKQKGSCAICGSVTSRTACTDYLLIDHCHTTDKIRGLLCHPCNTAIGLLKDDPGIMLKAAEYVSQ